MAMYGAIDTFVRGILGLGFFFMFLSYFEQTVWDRIEPVLQNVGMSQLGAQVIDWQFYGVDAFLVLGLLFIIMASVVWMANWS